MPIFSLHPVLLMSASVTSWPLRWKYIGSCTVEVANVVHTSSSLTWASVTYVHHRFHSSPDTVMVRLSFLLCLLSLQASADTFINKLKPVDNVSVCVSIFFSSAF